MKKKEKYNSKVNSDNDDSVSEDEFSEESDKEDKIQKEDSKIFFVE